MSLMVCRIVVMGSGGVGKTSLITQFLKGTYRGVYFPTVEDTYVHTVTMADGERRRIELVDTAGLHTIPAKQQFNIKSGHAFILVYDVTNILSFVNVLDLADNIIYTKDEKRTCMMLVGSKIDLENRRQVAASEGQAEANKRNCSFMEASGMDNASVSAVFMELLERVDQLKGKISEKERKRRRRKRLKRKQSKNRKDIKEANTQPWWLRQELSACVSNGKAVKENAEREPNTEIREKEGEAGYGKEAEKDSKDKTHIKEATGKADTTAGMNGEAKKQKKGGEEMSHKKRKEGMCLIM